MYPPIADYALLSDCHGAALVARDGSVDWCCFRRVDSRPVFARLLDRENGGHFRIAPSSSFEATRRYLPETMVLETRFETRGGVVSLTDCLTAAVDGDDPPQHRLVRVARCLEGEVELDLEFRPRFDYGLTVPRLAMHAESLGVVVGGADALVVQSQLPLEQTGLCHCVATARLSEGESAITVLEHAAPHELDPKRFRLDEVEESVERTAAAWREWSSRREYAGRSRDAVLRSLLVLKALTNGATGAIVAAPTTSLPEQPGGSANWDYRYAWLRDAGLTVRALFETGCAKEGKAYVAWLERTSAGRAEDLQIMFGVGGERLLPEVELDHLEGYASSAPVRIGNAASAQHQLDVLGEVVETAHALSRAGGELTDGFWDFIRRVVDAIAERWREPDSGIWEQRTRAKHWVHSKALAWVGVSRAVLLAEELGLDAPLDEWRALADEIRADIDEHGVRDGIFVQAYESDAPDASVLLLPLVGFVPFDDERVRRTVERIERELGEGDGIRRNLDEPAEGSFVCCGSWLAHVLAGMGEVERARERFEALLAGANDLGLLAEQQERGTGALLGNFPQAFSHVGLVLAALALDEAERGAP